MMADLETNRIYELQRSRGQRPVRANGYLCGLLFRHEQRVALEALAEDAGHGGVILDIGCGTGLMVRPLVRRRVRYVIGIDFNESACRASAAGGLCTVRGDAFALPLQDRAVSQILSCQFLNQQTDTATRQFLGECARVLEPGGRLVLLWRNAASLLHRIAAVLLRIARADLARFVQHTHPPGEVEDLARGLGFRVLRRGCTLPGFGLAQGDGWLARVLGASWLLVLEKDPGPLQ